MNEQRKFNSQCAYGENKVEVNTNQISFQMSVGNLINYERKSPDSEKNKQKKRCVVMCSPCLAGNLL